MINKKNLWFLTLFSLILVLSVYYITMPSELLLTNSSNYVTNTSKNKSKKTIHGNWPGRNREKKQTYAYFFDYSGRNSNCRAVHAHAEGLDDFAR